MTQEPTSYSTPTASPAPEKKKDLHLLDFFSAMARNKRIVFLYMIGFGFFFFAFTYIMPFTYSGLSTLVPPEKQSGGSQLLSFLTGSGGSGALDLMKSAENPALDMFKNILDSRTVSEEIARDPRIRRYFSSWDTTERYIGYMVNECLTSEPLRNGIFNVQVDIKTHWFPSGAEKDSARALVPYLAKLFVEHLDYYNRERLMTTARNTRIFVEGEYKSRILQLDTAYTHLQAFQQEHKAIALTEQLAAAVTSAAQLSSQEQQLSIQVAAAEREMSPNAGQIEILRSQLDETRRQLKKYDEGGVGEYVLALDSVPTLTRTLAKLTREVKMLETVSAYLRQQLEQERINEQRNLPTLTVLDSAIVPERKSSPKRAVMLALGVFAGLFISILYVIWKKFKENVREHPQEHTRYLMFLSYLKGKKATS